MALKKCIAILCCAICLCGCAKKEDDTPKRQTLMLSDGIYDTWITDKFAWSLLASNSDAMPQHGSYSQNFSYDEDTGVYTFSGGGWMYTNKIYSEVHNGVRIASDNKDAISVALKYLDRWKEGDAVLIAEYEGTPDSYRLKAYVNGNSWEVSYMWR